MRGPPNIASVYRSILCGPVVITIAVCALPPSAQAAAPRDSDRDGLSDWTETKRTRTNPNRRDTDRDRLSDWTEVRRTRTNPRRRDTDGDGLSDWTEVRRTNTDPRNPGGVLGLQLQPPPLVPDPEPAPAPPGPGEPEPLPPPPDTTPPETKIGAKPAALANSASASFEFSGLDPPGVAVATFECRLDGGSWAACTSPRQYTALADGQHEFEVRSVDAAANADPSPATHGWQIDTVPPTLAIESGPDGLTNDATPTFGFSSEPGATLACSIDTGTPSFGPCSGADAHTPASPLGEGDQTFRVRATDAAGNEAGATRGFHVDTAAPSAPLLTETLPASPANDNTPEVVGSTPPGATIATIDVYAGGACSGPALATATPAALAAGVEVAVSDDSTTVFRATATTTAGNTSGCSEPLAYVEDSSAPATEISAQPPPLTNSPAATFSFAADDPGGTGVVSFECRLDAGSWATCTSPRSYTQIADGPHAFEVRAVDAAGNVDQSPALAGWHVDTLPPALVIESGPAGLTDDSTPTFDFSAPDAGFECSLDKGTASFGSCSGAGTHTPAVALADGSWTFRVRATDAAGNRAVAIRDFSVDATAPETELGAKPGELVNSATASFSFSGSDGGSGVAFLECRIDGGPFVACTSPREHTGLSEGHHSFQARAFDQAGNVDPTPASHAWQVDLTPPELQIGSGPDGLTNDATPTFAFSSEPGASLQCSVDKGTASFGPCSGAGTHTPSPALADGSWTFRVRATDGAANQATATRGFQVDTAIPAAPALSATVPASPANHNSPVLTGSAPAGTTVRLYTGAGCSGGPISTVAAMALGTGIELSVADDSTTQLSATATTAAENSSSCSAPIAYVEDSTAPGTQITANPPALTNATTASFSFTGSDPGGSGVASFECRLDSGAFGACAAPRQYSGLSEGSHSFQVRASDKAGNADATPATHTWQVDTTPPALSIDTGPDGLTSDSTPTFSFSAPGADFECSVDKGTASFGPCSGAGTHTPSPALADGSWTFRVRATDGAANQATATRGFQVDTAAPPAPALGSSAPASPANHNAPRVLGSATAGTTVRLYGGGACSGSPLATLSPEVLAAGVEVSVADDSTTVFRATATTVAGNVSGCSEPLSYVEDSTAPDTQIGAKPASLVNSATASFSFTGSDPGGSGAASFECRLDAGAFASCTPPRGYTALAEGAHSFDVRAIDSAGNVDATAAGHAWTIDLTPPAVQIDSGPTGFTGDTTPTFGFSSAGAGFECSLDKGTASFGACSGAGTHTPAALADGAWTFRVRATDGAGNQAVASRGFTVDATPPDAQITAQPAALTNATAASFSFTGSDPGGSGVASFQCKLDGGAFAACASPRELTGLTEGSHSFQVRAIDAVGNVDGAPASYSWQVDLTPPAVQIESGPTGPTNDTTPTVTFSATTGAALACSVDQGSTAFAPCSGAGSHTPAAALADGSWTFRVRAADAAGNQATVTRAVEVDATPPETQIGAKPAALVNSGAASFSFSGSDAGSGVASLRCKLDNGSFAVCTSPREHTGLAEGSHTFQARAFDGAGNVDESPATHTWTVDLTPPVVQIDSGPSGFTADTTPSFAFSASGATFECSLDKGAASFGACSDTGTHTPSPALADGSWTFRVRAADAAGNQAVASRGFSVDATAPDTSIGTKPAALVNSTVASFSFGSSDAGSGLASFQCKLDGGAFTTCASPREYTGLGEGDHTVQVRAIDQVGNVDGTPATHTWTVDLTPPVVQIDSGPSGFTADTTPSFGFSSEPGAAFACSLDTGSPSFGSCSAAGSHTPAAALPDGARSFRVRATDAAGNQATATRGFSIDATPPSTQITAQPAALTKATTASFSFTGSDPGGSGVASFECRLDGGGFTACTSPREHTALAAGSHSFEVRAVDGVGNTDASPASYTWTVDLAAPAVQIGSGPEGLTNDATPSFGFSSEAGATLACSLDKGTASFGSCSGAGTHTPAAALADGAWTFRVQAADAAGNQAVATRGFSVDATPPDTAIGTKPAALVNSTAANLSFSGSDPGGSGIASFECKLDAGAFAVCTSPREYTGLGAGGHTVQVRAIDAAGNADGSPAAHSWTIDLTPPAVQVDTGPDGPSADTTPTFGFSSEAGATFQCSVDKGTASFGACSETGAHTPAALADGSWTFRVRATDAAGNQAVASRGFSVDATPPDTSIGTKPAAQVSSTAATFSFSGSDPGGSGVGSFECKLDGGAFAACASPRELTGLAEGSHSFQVRAIDAAGNADGSPASYSWQIDLTPPAVQIDSGPAGFTNDTTPSFAFSSPGASFECSVDKGTASFGPCSAGGTHTPAALLDGAWTFRVRATDAAGNQAIATRAFTVDATPPDTSIGAKPAAQVNSAAANFTFSGSDPGGSGVASFECKLDAGAFAACASPREYTGLGAGSHTLQVRATDQASNADASPATHAWTVDLTPPSVQIDSGPGGFTNDTTPTYAFSSEPGATFACSLDTGTPSFGACSAAGTHTPASPLPEGARSFRVRATDAAGNQATATRAFTVDATPPETQIGAKPAALVNTATATFSFTGSDPGGSGVASFECKLDGSAFAACTTPHELTGLGEGGRTFQVRAIDQAGNADSSPATHTWQIDLTPPALVIESGPDGLTSDPTPTFAFSAPGATFLCSLDKGTPSFGPCSGADTHAPASPLADGAWTFRVRATDAATNQATATRGFQVDTTAPPAPQLTSTVPPSPANDNAPRVLGASVAGTTVRLFSGGTCAGSALATVTPAELAAGIEVSVADDTTTVFRATATTAAGIPSGCSEQLAYVEDSSAPQTTITAQPAALTNSATATFSFSGGDGGGSGVASFECKLDAQPFGPCASGAELTGLGHGAHSFEVRAVDGAGNVDASPASHTWQVDLSAPQVTIDSVSKTLLRLMSTSTLTWHGDENGPFELRVGGADCTTGTVIGSGAYGTQPAARTSNVTGAQLAEGANTLRLCLADAAGNRGAATATLTRDSVSPETQITLGPPALVNVATASFSFTGSDPGGSGVTSFRCSLDGGSFTLCTSPRAYSGLGEGLHIFEVRATDQAGNSDESTDELEWRVDLTPPALTIEAGPDGLTNDATPTFRYSSEPGAGFACSLDTGAPSFGPCSGAGAHTPASPLGEGPQTFRVRATDAAGNQATATRDFLVDSTAAPAPELSPTVPASPANHNAPRVSGTAAAAATVRLYAGPCSGSPLVTLTPAELEAGVEIAVADDTTTVFRATATMPDEDVSGCSEPLAYVEDSTAPQTAIASAPPPTTLSTSATFFLGASESGASLECSLDGAAFGACASPRSHANLAPGPHSFAVRATDAAGNLDPSPAETTWTIAPPPSSWPSACVPGATEATTAAALRAAVDSGKDACVTADVGNVDLGDLGARPVVVSTSGNGMMGAVDLGSTTDLTISQARLRSVTIRNSHRTRLLGNTIGGTPTARVSDQLIFMPETNNDVLIEGNDIGWTIADDTGNAGYGCRCYGTLNRLRFVGNKLHDLAADGFQGVGGVDVVIDRNEIGPVGRNPESDEHSDSIQITGNDANLRITNNWIHHQGYYNGEVTANAGSTYIHGDGTDTLTYENNLIETVEGRTEICGLGTGGVERSNITIRRNTWVDGGKAFNGFPGFEWDCDGGAGNVITRNIAIDPDGGLADNGYDAALIAPNLFGTPSLVTLDADRNCISANCNPASEEPIGYRKPSGVAW